MEIVSLIPAYLDVIGGRMQVDCYRNINLPLFSHYETYWGGDVHQITTLTETEVKEREQRIVSKVYQFEKMLADEDIFMDRIKVVIFVGNNVSNGHAFFENDRVTVWLPLEAYESQEQVEVFVPHELLHGLQYLHTSELAVKLGEGHPSVLTKFVVEGVATFFTMRFYHLSKKDVLWANYISDEDFSKWEQGSSYRKTAESILLGKDHTFFTASTGYGREGYLLSLLWAQEFFKGMTFQQVLDLDVGGLLKQAEYFLKMKTAVPSEEQP